MESIVSPKEKDLSVPALMDQMSLYELEQITGSINYGRQLQLQFKRLTKKRFSVTKIEGIHPSQAFNVRRIA